MKISLKEDITSLSYFKANFNQILEKMNHNHRPMILTQNGKSAGVFMDIETWETLLKKIQVLKMINEGERSLQKGNEVSLEAAEESLKKKYGL
ncbi:type II toxin-antitoxin system Phd/YefM family antitoxin [Spirochaeta isovalerica]|uniref:Antitoxin n=1 Tax=Spirochaeta isovalerica TaxID=150 RepID=A0A841R9Z6_9SPIO|nr:type II toxin-antitoxin system Phd/YefM family antitoxin [Spirochaeta isovalerica]MBB6480725.1 prevent-host-death family protein [Spirochaeta isovalerica]